MMDIVVLDAPCSGTGVWRRRPDAKWKLSETVIRERVKEQRGVLNKAIKYNKENGKIVYITCSVLPQENKEQIIWFLEQHPEYSAIDIKKQLDSLLPNISDLHNHAYIDQYGITLTPKKTGSDGFFISVLERNK